VSDAERPPWPWWTGPVALFLALAMALVAGSIVYGIAEATVGDAQDRPGANLAATLVGDLCFVGAALFFAQMAGRVTPQQFGLRSFRVGPAIGWAILAYVVFALIGGAFIEIVGVDEEDRTLDNLGVDESTAALIAAMLLVTTVVPVCEELLFRGYVFTALRGSFGVIGAALLSGTLFGLIHADPDRPAAYLLPLALFGVMLALLYWKTGSLWPPIGLHAINNAIAFGASEDWTWQIPVLAAGALTLIYIPARLTARRLA
jgi:membrane protease YdiL (CAAX protease family)